MTSYASAPALGADDTDESIVVLWDLDDTLFDHAGTSRRALAVVRREFPALGRRPLPDVHREYLELVERLHARMQSGALSATEARTLRFAELLGRAGRIPGPGEARQMAELYSETYARERRPVPGAAVLLRYLADRVVQGVVSNNPAEEQADKLRAIGLDRWVRFVVTSQEVGAPKPDPAIFHAALDRAGAVPARAVMVGDSWATDVLGARAVGIRAVWFNRRALPIPDPTFATELRDLRPVRTASPVVLGASKTGLLRRAPPSE